MRIAAILALGALTACSGANDTPREACVKRGVAYFKSVGSHPKMEDGREAEAVALNRCNNSGNKAFE